MHILILISLLPPPPQVSKTEIDRFAPSLVRRCRSIGKGRKVQGGTLARHTGGTPQRQRDVLFQEERTVIKARKRRMEKGYDIEAASRERNTEISLGACVERHPRKKRRGKRRADRDRAELSSTRISPRGVKSISTGC